MSDKNIEEVFTEEELLSDETSDTNDETAKIKETNESNFDQTTPSTNIQDLDEEELTPWQRANLDYLRKQKIKKPHAKKSIDTNQKITSKEKQEIPINIDKEDGYQRELKKFIILAILLFIGALGAIYYTLPISYINVIDVQGNNLVETKSITTALTIQPNKRFLPALFKLSEQEQILKNKYPAIKEVNVSPSGINNINVVVKEYSVVGYLVKKVHYYQILADGTIIKTPVTPDTSKNILYIGFEEGELLKTTILQYQEINSETKELITQIQSTPRDSNPELLTLFMSDGNQVLINAANMAERLQKYSQVAAQMSEKGVVDMEAGIFSYPYGNDLLSNNTSNSE